MASPQPQSRILRIGLLQDGRILEERHLRKPGDFTVGQDPKCSLVLPLPELPASFPVFEFRAGQYNLVFNDDMQGRVNLGSSDVDFHTLRTQSMAMERGDQYVLPLQESARGVVELDEDLRLFFQFIQPTAETDRPQLPPDLQGGSWRTMDRMFFGILAASLLLHFSGAALIIASEPPPEPELELDQLDDRFARVLMPPKQEEPKQQAADTAQAAADTEKDKPKESDSDKKPSEDTASKPASPQEAAARRAEVAKKVSGKGLLKILGSSGGGGGGAFSDVLGGSTGGGDIAEALAGAGGVGIATEASVGANGPRGGGTGKVAGIGDLGTSGGGKVDLGSKKEVEVSGRVTASTPEVESSDVDREALARYIKTRLKAIQGCYEKELKRNPSLKGKVMVRFNIMPSGRTGEIEIEENTLGNDAVASCIRTVVRGWVFPFKPDDEVPVAYPFVFTPAG
ncbi:AgmX/PglI C-terminal domain-containing protein [Archangium lansingense]|uniref:AgmX/PglI C-terminal domain-containing protein n=1 Tax=Archangium lansingense TaxID=2995310 RepID=A0ABT4A1N5_9BACT|nr:AgmX/PglI C-terminal domain-containing protein [Archangium lansinium]MCY1075555.1 AgmX/PglI C-terminal domain-containing protein [Archangium lansinium]